jgi:hypothetical protein
MSALKVRPFHRDDRDQLTELVPYGQLSGLARELSAHCRGVVPADGV